MPAFSYPVTFASGKQGAIDSPVELSADQLQAQVADYDRQDQEQAQAANVRAQADQQAGRGASYLGTAGRSFVAPLASTTRGIGEILDSPTLIRGGNELEQDTASYLPTNPQYANELPGKVIGSTAGLAGGILPFALPLGVGEVAGPASIVAQTYDSGLREGLNAGLPLSTAQDYARTHVALQAPLQIAGGRVVRGLVGGEPANVLPTELPTLSDRLSTLGAGALEAGGIGSASQLASNLQAGSTGYNIDPNRGALDDVLSSGALMAGSAGLLGLPSAFLRGRAATPTVDTTSSAQPDASAVPDPAAAATPDTTTPTPPASDGTSATPPVDATGTTSAQSTSGLDADTIAKFNARYSTPPSSVDGDLSNVLPASGPGLVSAYRASVAGEPIVTPPPSAEEVTARIRAATQAQAEKNAATLDAVNQASATADQAEASAAPLTAQALRQNAQETLATATGTETPRPLDSIDRSTEVPFAEPQVPAASTPEPVAQDATPPASVAESPPPIEPFRSPIAPEQTEAPAPPVDTVAPTPQASTETPSPVSAPVESEVKAATADTGTEAPAVSDVSADNSPLQNGSVGRDRDFSSQEPTQAATLEQALRLDDRGLPITTIQSDPTEAMRASPDVEATGDTVKELPSKEQTYGSRVNTDYFHLPQERSEYTRETSELPPHPDEADLLTQANTALQRRRYEVENKVGGYEGRGGTNAVDRVLSAAYLKYLRNLREGTSGKDGFKSSEVGQVLNNVIRDFQKGASKRKMTVALDAPTADGGRTVGDSVPDDAPTPAEQVQQSDARTRLESVTADFAKTLDARDKGRLNDILERVLDGEPPHELSADDIELYDRFIEHARPQFGRSEISPARPVERTPGEATAREQGRAPAPDKSPSAGRQGVGERDDADAERRTTAQPEDQPSSTDGQAAESVEEGAGVTARYAPSGEYGQRYLEPELNGVLDDALTQALPTLRRFGVGVEENAKASRGQAASFNFLGHLSLEINRENLAKNLANLETPQEKVEFIRHGVSEEITHLADLVNERNAWNASGRKVDFDDFTRGRKVEMLNSINREVADANPRTKAVLQGALLDGWNLYHDAQQTNVVDADGARAKTAGNDVAFSFDDPKELQKYLSEHPDQVTGYMMETLRQLVQLRETDPAITTEASYLSIYEELKAFVNRILEQLRVVASDPKAYSKVLADAISQIERVKNGEPLDFIPRIRADVPEVRPVDRETVRANVPEAKFKSEARDPDKAVHDFVENLTGIRPAESSRPKLELPSAREKAKEAVASAKTAGGRILQAVKKIGDFVPLTDKDVVLRRLSENEQLNDARVRRVQNAFNEAVPDPKTREAINAYRDLGGDRQALERAVQEVPKPEQKARYQRALSLTPDEIKVAGELDKVYAAVGEDAVAKGRVQQLRENYAPRYVNRPFLERMGLEDATSGGLGRFTKNFRSANNRVFESIPDLEKAGYNLSSYDAGENLAKYLHEYGKLQNTEDFINDAKAAKGGDGRPGVDVRSDPPELSPNATDEEFEAAKQATRHDYVPTGAQGVFGNLAFHPDFVRSNGRSGDIRNIFKTSAISKYLNAPSSNLAEAGVKLGIRGIKKTQDVIRSTMFDLSPFHATTEAVGAAGHGVNPFSKIERFDPSNPAHREAIASGLQIVPRIGSEKQFSSDLQGDSSSLVRKVPGLGWAAEKLSHFVFEDYIPSLKLKIFQKALARNLELTKADIDSGKLTRQDVAATTAEQVNDHLGHQNLTALARNPTMQDVFRIVALAPDFLESRYNFARGAVQGLSGKAGTREQLRTFAILFGAQFIATRIFNKALDDDYHWDRPFSFVKGNRAYTLRSVPEDLLAAITDPTKFAAGRESPLVRTGIQLLTGRNYRGEKVTTGQTLQESATSGIPIGLKGLPAFDHLNVTQRNQVQSWFDRIFDFAGLHAQRLNPEESLYALANQYKKAQGIATDDGAYHTSPYTPVRNALADGNVERARQELQSIYSDSGKTRQQIMQSLQSSFLHPYTGSQKSDQQFLASLSPDDRARVRQAQAARVQLLGQARQLVASLPANPNPVLAAAK